MQTRPLTGDDVPALVQLRQAWDTHWFGAPEQDEEELREELDRAEGTLAVVEGGTLVAASWWSSTGSAVLVELSAPRYDVILPWLEQQGRSELEVLERDLDLCAAVEERGFRHVRSSFELIRPVSEDWVLPAPTWPEGIRTTGFEQPERVHELVYVDAGWTDVPGHHHRDLEEWLGIFVTDKELPEEQVLAWDGEQLVGAAIGRIWSDGTGWVSQLAVARSHRGKGLGKALLLDVLHRRIACGASSLGLSVSAENRDALQLYLGVGLRIDREWKDYLKG